MNKTETIRKAVELGTKLQHVFVGTTNADGLPHLAAASVISLVSEGRVAVESWFCPGTVINLEQNRSISLTVWDHIGDTGYQLFGEVEKIEEKAFMDGYAPEMEHLEPSPQVERRLIVRVEKIVGFSHAPHSDVEE
jgi:hypothetical protein